MRRKHKTTASMPNIKQKSIQWTLHSASLEFGVSRESVARGLRQSGVKTTSFAKYSTKQIFTAIAGDARAERTRNLKLDADRKTIELAEASSQLMNRDRVEETLWENALMPLRSGLMQLHRVTFKQVDQELDRALVAQPVRDTVQTLLVGAFDEMLADIRNSLPQQTAKSTTPNTSNEK